MHIFGASDKYCAYVKQALCIRLDRAQQGVASRTWLSFSPVKPRAPNAQRALENLNMGPARPGSNYPYVLSRCPIMMMIIMMMIINTCLSALLSRAPTTPVDPVHKPKHGGYCYSTNTPQLGRPARPGLIIPRRCVQWRTRDSRPDPRSSLPAVGQLNRGPAPLDAVAVRSRWRAAGLAKVFCIKKGPKKKKQRWSRDCSYSYSLTHPSFSVRSTVTIPPTLPSIFTPSNSAPSPESEPSVAQYPCHTPAFPMASPSTRAEAIRKAGVWHG